MTRVSNPSILVITVLSVLLCQLPGITAAQNQPPPTTYDALSDRTPRAEPQLPALGPAGYRFVDPTFGTRMLRVTDANTRPDKRNRAYHTPSSAEQNCWNADGTIFYVEDGGGAVIPYSFDQATMTASRMGNTANSTGGLLVTLRASPAFSYTDPKLIYGVGGSNARTIRQYNFQTNVYTDLLNLNTVVQNLTGFTGDLTVSANDRFATYFGGSRQDEHFYVIAWDKNTGERHLLDTLNSTLDGAPLPAALGWRIHNARIDKSGRYVVITRANAGPFVWDTEAGTVAEITARPRGHRVAGFGTLINHDGGDGAQWQRRSLDAAGLGTTFELIQPQFSPAQAVLTSHLSWNNAEADSLVPVLASTYRSLSATTEWRAWDNEIIAIRADGVESTVWRFAHHRSEPVSFSDTPRGNVSQQGRFFIFTSNWERTLGTSRQDVFIVELATAADTAAPVISNVTVSSITESGAEITWETNEPGDTQVEYGATSAYGSASPPDSSLVTSHSVTLAGLEPNRLYHYRVRSRDGVGNLSASADFTFTTAADTRPPAISAVSASNITSASARITWTTDEAADSQIEYGTTTAYGSATTLDASPVTSHAQSLAGLLAGTLYHYRVKSRDGAGNLAVSADFIFTTGNTGDVIWTQIVNCTASGNSLQKTAGRSDTADAGAVSQQAITSGDGYLEFTISEANRERWCGLSRGNTDTTGADIDFALKLTTTGIAAVRENNVYKTERAYAVGDVFRIAVVAGVVKYYKNGVLFYTSTKAPAYPLLVDTSFIQQGGTITNAILVSQ